MSLLQLIYASRPFGFDDLALSGILNTARLNNARDDITGALICREDLYLQLLEGPRPLVTALYERIQRDDRHAEVVNLWSGDIDTRLFPDWAMKHDPARSWMWTAAQVTAGAVAKATPEEARGVFQRLAREPGQLKVEA
jgi:Sensors of blue-light using FAD